MEVGSIFLCTLSNRVKSNHISLVFVISCTGITYFTDLRLGQGSIRPTCMHGYSGGKSNSWAVTVLHVQMGYFRPIGFAWNALNRQEWNVSLLDAIVSISDVKMLGQFNTFNPCLKQGMFCQKRWDHKSLWYKLYQIPNHANCKMNRYTYHCWATSWYFHLKKAK